MFVYYLILVSSSASNINCIDSSCSSCTSGYLYNAKSCLPLCPTGYTQSTSPNICTATSSQSLFYLRFWEFRQFTATSIGNFQHPSGLQFQNSAKGSPIPTMERGFYFVSTSKLKSTVNYIIGPDFSLRFCIRIKADGTILEATSGGISYFKLSAVAGQVIAYWYLTSSSTSTTYSVTGITYSTHWALITVYSSQSTGTFLMSNSGNSNTASNFEFRGEVSNLLIYFGGDTTSSFTGFIDETYADNSVITSYSRISPYILCEYNEYFSTVTTLCTACTGCSSTWPWCTRASCTICYSSTCSACTGYTWQYCTGCNTAKTAPNCILGRNCAVGSAIFTCTSCNSGYTLIDGLCLYAPYGYNAATLSTPVIDLTFNTFAQYYGPFQSGSGASTYGPWTSPATDDPIPVNNRGLYFDGLTKYLVSTSNVALNYKSSIAMWFYPQSGMVMSTYNFYFYSSGYGGIYASNPDEAWYMYTVLIQTYLNQWVFGAYTINFSSNTLSVAYTIGTTTTTFLSLDGFAFYDYYAGLMWIGQYASYAGNFNFLGFIYSFTVWQSAITDFSSKYNTCGSGLSNTCITACTLVQYYNTYQKTCASCDASCTSGCRQWGTCNKCLNSDCATCTNFNNTCTSTIANPCLSGYTFIASSKACCNSACADCYGPASYNCKSCSASKYLLSQVCLTTCPTGYSVSGTNCVSYLNPIINLNFNVIKDSILDSGRGILFSTGSNTNFYPSGTSSDPIPAMQRGYYFTSASYISSQSFTIPYNFTMVFYLKHLTGGKLLTKNTFTIATSSSVAFTITSVIAATFASITNTDWIVMAFNLWTVMDGTTTCTVTYPPGTASSISASSVIYLDDTSGLTLGASSGSFVGFIYQFLIYAYPQDVSAFTATMCADSSGTSCMWNCGIAYYLSGSSCSACLGTCSGGCRRGTDCNLCNDVICSVCDSFTATCTTCLTNAALISSVCACNTNYYWSANQCTACPASTYWVSGTCYNCDATCLSCTAAGTTSCSTCHTHATKQADNSCLCDNLYYWDGTACSSCYSRCLTCSGSLINNCINCITNAAIDANHQCNCNSHYYWDGSACTTCSSTCKDCTGGSATQCYDCYDHATIQADFSCICDNYYYWTGSACASCYSTCLTCTANTISTCSTCRVVTPALSFSSGTCSCPNQYYWDGSLCQSCSAQCLTCSDSASTSCLTCFSDAAKQADNSCLCNDLFYWDGAACSSCYSRCLTCSGSLINNCINCITNAAIDANHQCNCNSHYYWDGSACTTCSSTCKECTGSSATQCYSCYDHATIQADFSCTCDNYYYWTGGACESCYSTCLTCTASTSSTCSACRVLTPVLSLSSGTCSCPSQYYWDGSLCQSCSAQCLTCSDSASTSCLTCFSDATKQADNSCLCHDLFYWDGAACSSCYSRCLTCSGSLINNCINCITNAAIDANHQCNCDNHYYWDGSACTACSLMCKECTGSSATQCYSCYDHATIQADFSCKCDDYYYWTGSACDSCYSTCLTCTASTSSTCSTCKVVTPALLFSSGTCSCPSQYYWDGSLCQSCSEQCMTCTDSASTSCLTCFLHATKQADNSCTCDNGYFWDSTLCSLCDPTCATCTAGSSSDCVNCYSNASRNVLNQCNCDLTFYWAGSSCESCSSQCLTCTGPSSTECYDCFTDATLQLDSSCLCDLNFYWNGSGCEACDPTCLRCSGILATQCDSCQSHATLQADFTCICDTSFVWTGSECSACYASCLTCSGINMDQCIICTTGLNLQADSTCSCDEFFYWNFSDLMCQPCEDTCQTCNGPNANNCITCRDNASVDNGVCTCNQGYYWDSVDLICRECDASCVMCTGPTSNDCICLDHSTQVGMTCICDDGYYMNVNVCEPCHNSCLTCNGKTFYQCTSCSTNLHEVICLSYCPVGYEAFNHTCRGIIKDGPVVQYVFNTIQGVFTDDINNLLALTGKNENYYPDLDTTDPIPSYERGIYFTGTGSYLVFPYLATNILLLDIRFSISVWVNPASSSGIFFHKVQDSTTLFSVSMTNLYPSIHILVDSTTYTFTSIYVLNLNLWNHLLVSVDYSSISQMSITVNKLYSESNIENAPFMDSLNTLMYVGSTSQLTEYLTGFMYSLAIYASIPPVDTLATTVCDDCPVCELSGICIPICNITNYYSASISACLPCDITCINGCRNSENCNLCYDTNCKNCKTYENNGCNQCIADYGLSNSTCIKCNSLQYYDTSSASCKDCPGLCSACTSASFCTTCVKDSSLNANLCKCDKGYSGTTACTQNTFIAYISINSDNQATISFTESLIKKLTTSDITVKVESVLQEYTITFIDLSKFKITVNFTADVTNNDNLNIHFINEILSEKNSLLITKNLSIKLFASAYNNLLSKISEYKSYSQLGMTIGMSAALGTSALNVDPTSFFNFLNSAEIYSYIVLYQVDINDILVAFLGELRINSKIPNVYSYAVDANQGVPMDGKINVFGNDTNLLLLNSGVNMTIFAIFAIVSGLVYYLHGFKSVWLKEKTAKAGKYLKYGFFLRLWIQSYLEILLSSSLGVLYSKFENITQIVDFSLCCILLCIQIFGIGYLVYLIQKRSKLVGEELEQFLSKYRTFFDEFKKEKISSWLFYLIFVVRRFSIIFLILFIEDPIIQLSLSVSFTLFIPIYLLATGAYVENVTGAYIILNEVLTCIYYIIISLPYISGLAMTSEHTAMNCIMIILVALVLNILSSLILTIKNIREWIRKRRDNALNTVAPIAAPEYNITTFQDFTIREQKIT